MEQSNKTFIVGCVPGVGPIKVYTTIKWILDSKVNEKRQQCRASQYVDNNEPELNGTMKQNFHCKFHI